MSKKIVPGIWRFVSMFFKYLKKRMSKKIVPSVFEICKYAFFKYLKKGMSKTNVLSILRFVSMPF